MKKNLKEKLKKIKLLMLDVDGIMTDGRIIMNDEGCETKHFNVRDGHGLKILQRFNIKVAIITGRQSKVVSHRQEIWTLQMSIRKYTTRKKSLRKF